MKVSEINPATAMLQHRFHFLDALRGVAAILVMFRHAPQNYSRNLNFYNSFLAVDFFFLLSGFVIAFSYEKRLRSFLAPRSFFIMRIIRLYPISILGTLLGGMEAAWVLHKSHPMHGIGNFLLNCFLGLLVLPHLKFSLPDTGIFIINGVQWSLFFELVANFFYVALVHMKVAGTKVVAGVSLTSLIVIAMERYHLGTLDSGYSSTTLLLGFARVGFSFFAGILLYRAYERAQRPRIRGQRASWIAMFSCAVFILVLMDSHNVSHLPLAQLIFIGLAFPALVYLGALVHIPMRVAFLCAFLGDVSYPIYILHPLLIWPIRQGLAIRFADAHPSWTTAALLCYSVFVIFGAWLAFRFYDTPIRRRLTSYTRRQQVAPQIAAREFGVS